MSDSADQPAILSPSQAALLRMLYGAQTAQVLYVAARLGVADALEDGPRDSAEVAAATGVDRSVLRRVLRALVSLGVCDELAGDRFALTEVGQHLRSDRLDSLQARAIFNGEVLFPLWGELLHTVTTGESAMLRVFGMPLYQYLTEHPDKGAVFDRAMAGYARYRLGHTVTAYDFSRFATIVDVGGGNGALLISILRTYPQPRGIVFDLPPVAARARRNIEAAGLADRCTAAGGDALEGVPEGGDAYTLSNFLIGLDDDRAATILGHCRRAMRTDGRLVLIEWVMPTVDEAADPFRFWDSAAIDLIMLAVGGSREGRVRTAEEFRTLLDAAGFTLAQIIPTGSSVRVIEALPRVS